MPEFLAKIIFNKKHTWWALLLGWVLLLLLFAAIDSLLKIVLDTNKIRFLIYLGILLLWLLYWVWFKYRLPRNKKNKIGVVIAIHAEESLEERRLKSDFIAQLQESVGKEGFADTINIIVLRNHRAEKIKSPKDVPDIHNKIKGHFYLWGKINRRSDGEKKFYLTLQGLVVHRPIATLAQTALAQDFVKLLPEQISFSEAFEFKGFKLTTEIVYLAVKYVTGMAAVLSGDPFLARQLHIQLDKEFANFSPLPQHLIEIKSKIPILLSEEERLIGFHNFNNGKLEECKKWIDLSLTSFSNNYGTWLLKAIYDFLALGDSKLALEDIKKAKKYANQTFEYRYSEAFLYLWRVNYKQALNVMKKIVSGTFPGEINTIQQVEVFLLDLLKKNDKPEIYFWLGFINYKKKQNISMALKYLESYETKATPAMALLTQESNLYLKDIRKTMGI